MEPLRKKKKIPHDDVCFGSIVKEENNHHNDENVKIIFDDRLESLMLKKQLGGNKIKLISQTRTCLTEFTVPDLSPYQSLERVRVCPHKEWLLLYCRGEKHIRIYDMKSSSLIRKIKLNSNNYFEVDSVGEHLYEFSDEELRKKRLDDLSLVWTVSLSGYNSCCFTICESKNELYTAWCNSTDLKVSILDMNDGSTKRTILREYSFYHSPLLSFITYNEKEDHVYVSIIDENCTYTSEHIVVIIDEKNDTRSSIWVEDQVGFFLSYRNYFICSTTFGEVFVYDKKTNDLLFKFKDGLGYSGISYFDNSTNVFQQYYHNTFNLTTFHNDIEENIIERPLNKEICLALEKLGGKLPSFIPKVQNDNEYVIPECLQYLLSVKFENSKFWYIDENIAKYFSFGCDCSLDITWMEENGAFLIGGSDQGKFSNCLVVKKSEISNDDFSIYLRYQNESKDEYIIKSFNLSEFISKLRVAEHIKVNDRYEYLINFEMIYEELLLKRIINPETREIDQSILLEHYQIIINRRTITYEALMKHFQNSTITFDNMDFKKIDLITLSELCSEHCLIKI
ncbi:predicted protein [Naegleria gruberi]|uniref:Predicted protein n=1 Tax=Naegleria gruberi TaxID=5762 RepID=D2VYH5_NAEGR|nr:uncharacterized protein NAEGRDRAFT_74123 [Naegleria gruberi]EFC38112.1 predicted protein [Naegleria gruberi]|eukprot:XP_002670856.1 predicted protein [Naegleria gruberi strain NEG-M]